MLTRRTTLAMLTASTAFLTTRPAFAAEPPVYAEDGVAIGGADPVAFFSLSEEEGPVIGSAAHAVDWNGASWHFANAENRALFEAIPDAYAPAFGGYCAFAAAQGYLANTVPEAWSVVEGRLFLNYSLRIRRRWLRQLPGAIAEGDANWPAILG